MITSIHFSPLPKDHVLIKYNYRIPPYNGNDAFDRTLAYVKEEYPGLIPPNISYGTQIAFILPIFNMHDDRLWLCIPKLSIDDFKDAAITLAESDIETFLIVLRYSSKEQFYALNSLPQICESLRRAQLKDVEPYLNMIDQTRRGWISNSPAFSPLALNNLFDLVHDGNTDARDLVKEIPPFTLVANNLNADRMAILSEFMSSDQIAFFAKNATFQVAIAVKRRLESIDSPLMEPFLQALEYNVNFIHLHPRYSLNDEYAELARKVQEIAERVKILSRAHFKTNEDSQFLDKAIAFHDSRYYKTASSLIAARLRKDEFKPFEQFNTLISKIKPPKAHESPVIPALANLLKTNISYFSSRFFDKKEFLEVCKYLKDTDPYFARTLSQLCLELIDTHPSLIIQIADTCNLYERNLLLSHLAKAATKEQKLNLASILHKYIDRFIELWETIEGAISEDDLISILTSCYDNVGSEFAINLSRIPVINRAIFNRLPALNTTLISAFISRADEETINKILASCEDYDRIAYLTKLSSISQKRYFKSLRLDEFRKLIHTLRVYNCTPVMLCVLKNGTDEELKEMGGLTWDFRNLKLDDLISFMEGISLERKIQIGEMPYKGMKAKDFVKASEPYNASSIPPFLFLFADLTDDYFKGTRADYFSETQVALIAKFGKRSHVLALEEGLKRNDQKHNYSKQFLAFYNALPLESNSREQLSLSECALNFNSKLKTLLEKGRFALKEFYSGNYDYDKVIKPLRRSINASYSNSFLALAKCIKENLPKEFDNKTYSAFLDLSNSIENLTWTGKDGVRHRIR